MKKRVLFISIVITIFLILSGCGNDKKQVKESEAVTTIATATATTTNPIKKESQMQDNINKTSQSSIKTSDVKDLKLTDNFSIEKIYNDFYIGEAVKSGFIYIEPFKIERTSYPDNVNYAAYPKTIDFYSIDKTYKFKALFNSKSNVYIPSIEEDSNYYYQGGFVEPNQSVLRYKSISNVSESAIGVTFFNHFLSNIDYSCSGEERLYSKSEYSSALNEVKKGIKDKNDLKGDLGDITIDNTIVGAKQICKISIKDANLKVLLSKYLYIGFESTADVYVMDFIDTNGRILKTFQKYNWSAY